MVVCAWTRTHIDTIVPSLHSVVIRTICVPANTMRTCESTQRRIDGWRTAEGWRPAKEEELEMDGTVSPSRGEKPLGQSGQCEFCCVFSAPAAQRDNVSKLKQEFCFLNRPR